MFAAAASGLATGYYGPSDYLSNSEESIQASPEFYWECEVKRLASAFHPAEKPRRANLGDATDSQEKAAPLLKVTEDADIADFDDALKQGNLKPADPSKARRQHAEARGVIGGMEEKPANKEAAGEEKKQEDQPADKQPATPPPALPEEGASEFADYHRGAYAFRLGREHWDEARKAWVMLLNRPAAERHYRSVWAAFMLGKLAMKSEDYPAAVMWFQKVRALAGEGFADSLGMAADSYGWEGRCEWKAGHPEKAAPLFLTQLALGDESAVISLKALIPDRSPVDGMLNYGPEVDDIQRWSKQEKQAAEEKTLRALKAAAADPLLRRLVTVHILSTETSPMWFDRSSGKAGQRCARWLDAVKNAQAGPVEDAEYLGWVAYTNADYDAAKRWLELAKADSAAANWLRSKLLRREGKLAEAAQSMQRAWQTILQPRGYTGWALPSEDPNADGCCGSAFHQEGFTFPGAASGELGVLRLARGEFVQALDTFSKGGLWGDAAFVAERVLSADELKAYVDQLPAGDASKPLRYLLGRRFVREDRYQEAARYLPAPYDKLLEKYVKALSEGADTKLPKAQRADAWLTAAWLARHDGMELMGTEVAPDGFGSRGAFSDTDIAAQRISGKYLTRDEQFNSDGTRETKPVGKPMVLPPTKEELARLAKHKIAPDTRYHYRVIAGVLAEKGARLLDDNTEKLADVLNTAGLWVKERDGKLADRLYSQLERRCPKTNIGKAVLAKHWFVEQEGEWRKAQQAAWEALHQELGMKEDGQ